MRIVKLYEQFINDTGGTFVSGINDIFVEVKDIGIDVEVQSSLKDSIILIILNSISSSIAIPNKDFNCNIFKDSILMLEDYISMNGYISKVSYSLDINDIERDNPLATDSICHDIYKRGISPHITTEEFPADIFTDRIYIKVLLEKNRVVKTQTVQESIGSVDDNIVRNIRDIFVEYQDKKALSVQVKKVSNISLYSTHLCNSKIPKETPVFGPDSYVVELYSNLGIKYDEISEYIDVLIDYINSMTDNEVSITYRINRIKILDYKGNFIAKEHTSSEGITMWGYDPTWIKMVEFFFKEEETLKVNESNIERGDKYNITDELDAGIKDIFVELLDEGIEVMTQSWNAKIIYITLSPVDYDSDRNYFNCLVADEYIKMLIDYMELQFGNSFTIIYHTHERDFTINNNVEDVIQNKYSDLPDVNTDELTIEFKFDEAYTYINESFGTFKGTYFDKVEADMKDIFIDWTDNGALCDINFYHQGVGYGVGANDYLIKVRFYYDKGFVTSDIEEDVKMLYDYISGITDKKVLIEYQLDNDRTNTRRSGTDFSPYGVATGVELYFIESAYKDVSESFVEDRNSRESYRIKDSINDIFTEYRDSHDLDIGIEFSNKGLGLPSNLMSLDEHVVEVRLFAQRGIRYADMRAEVGMLIEYIRSLTDSNVRIFYDIDKSGLRYWSPLAGNTEYEHDYYLENNSRIFNTIKLYFVG